MSNPYKVLVIVPAYNEAESICATVKAVIDSGYDYVVVNDGSTDNTLEICHANHLNVLDLPQNLGIGGAVQAGHKYAKKYGYNIDVQVDGDGPVSYTHLDVYKRQPLSSAPMSILVRNILSLGLPLPVELLIALVLSCSAFMLLAWIWVFTTLITIAGIQAKPTIP